MMSGKDDAPNLLCLRGRGYGWVNLSAPLRRLRVPQHDAHHWGGELLLCSTLPFPFLPPHQREDAHRSIHFFYPLPLSVQIWVPYALDAGCLQLNDAGGGERWCGEGAWERVLGRSVRVDQSRQRNVLTGNHSDKRSHVNSSLLPSGYMNKQL
jgi:hypothetical protein